MGINICSQKTIFFENRTLTFKLRAEELSEDKR